MSRRVLVREDGEKICLPGTHVPIGLEAARRVWDEGLCIQIDPELFFPGLGGSAEPARAICASCPVRWLCLDTFGPVVDHGVLGGFTPRQRRTLRRTDIPEAVAASACCDRSTEAAA
jgi:WhiB family transcriptional regulator, redox-sensing transcriptional regulator